MSYNSGQEQAVLTKEQKTEIQQEVARVLESLAMEGKWIGSTLRQGQSWASLLAEREGNPVKILLSETKADLLSAKLAADLASMMAPSSSQVQPLEPLVRIIARAVEVLGNSEKALRWINAPVRSLGDQTPVSLLSSPEGIERVEDALGSIEHGVW
jgi:predicted ATP-grasp superfamily ATP-dependent carboligase